jgi:hypothetical protein
MKNFKYLVLIIISISNATVINAQENTKPTPEFTGYHFLNSKG